MKSARRLSCASNHMPRNDAISHFGVCIPAPKHPPVFQTSQHTPTSVQFSPAINVPVPPRKRTSGPGVPSKATKTQRKAHLRTPISCQATSTSSNRSALLLHHQKKSRFEGGGGVTIFFVAGIPD
ncbi:hypothetical protein HDV57DRAFT_323890 [Trichoderma longibrachiatum]